MLKYIVMMAHASGCGSYGVGDTEGEARKKARQQWPGGKLKEVRVRTVDVPEDHELVIHTTLDGIEWYTVLKEKTEETPNELAGP